MTPTDTPKKHWYVNDRGRFQELALCGMVGARSYRAAGSPGEVTCRPCLKKMPPKESEMDEITALRSGLTIEGEAISEGETWIAAVRIRGVDNAGRPITLSLDTDELWRLEVLASDYLRAFLDPEYAEAVST